MRKITSLFMLLLLFVGTAIAQPDVAGKTFTLNCARGYVYYNGTQLAGTSDASAASEFALVNYDSQTYLFDVTNSKFVCHTTDARAGTTGNASLESATDLSKIAKGFTFGETGIAAYPYYLEDSWGNWLNMDGSPKVYLNTWQDFEGGNGGNTYNVTIVNQSFDPTVAEQILANYDPLAAYKENVIANIAGLSSISTYAATVAAINNATTEAEVSTALESLNVAITLQSRSGRYIAVGTSTVQYVDADTEYNTYIELESKGDGSFYMKGFKAGTYMGDVQVSTTVPTTATATTSFYIQNYNGYTVARPTGYADSGWSAGYHYLHNGGGNYNCVGWSADGANTQHTITEVQLPTNVVNVTYHIIVNGNDVAQISDAAEVGSTPNLPATYDYTTFTYDVANITAATTTINATATFSDLPFEFSTDYATAKWYVLNGHASYNDRYVSTNGDNTVWQAGHSYEDAYQWAFIGNPVEGVKVINKAAGDTKCLQATDPATMGTTDKYWVLKKQTTTTWQSGTKGFGLYDASKTYLNTQGSTLKYWSQFDQGSTYWASEVPNTPYYDDFAAMVSPFVTAAQSHAGELFQLAASGSALEDFGTRLNTATTNAQSNIDMTETEYNEGVAAFKAALVMPADGYYRIKNVSTGNYIRNAAAGSGNVKADLTSITTAVADAASVIKISTREDQQYFGSNGKEFSWCYTSSYPATNEDAGKYVHYAVTVPGQTAMAFVLGNGEGTYEGYTGASYYAPNSENVIVGSSSTAAAAQWIFEAAEEIILPMTENNGKYYATTYLPFAVRFDANTAIPYTVFVNSTEAIYTSIDSYEVPAETGVLLISDGATNGAVAEIIASAEAVTGNELRGHFFASNVENALVLNIVNGNIGFYSLSATGTLAANRAYIDKGTNNEIQAMQLVAGNATGIQNVTTKTGENKVFDLQGRRVQNAQKGLYIVNGKKVIL